MNNLSQSESLYEDQIDLIKLVFLIWRGKILIIFVAILFSISSILYALSLPNIYRSEALLAPVEEQASLYASVKNFSNLAGLAGINLPNTSMSKTSQAIEVLSSNSFFTDKILPNIYLPDLMANPTWDPVTGTLRYDDNLYDSENGNWLMDTGNPLKTTPTDQESYNYFIENIFAITVDDKTGFITLSTNHVSPYIARDWTELIINKINEKFRARDLESAKLSIKYLNDQISMANVIELREGLYQLLMQQTQISMLVDANSEYVFAVLDKPVIPELKYSPRRSVIVIMMTFLGMFFGMVVVVFKDYISKDYEVV